MLDGLGAILAFVLPVAVAIVLARWFARWCVARIERRMLPVWAPEPPSFRARHLGFLSLLAAAAILLLVAGQLLFSLYTAPELALVPLHRWLFGDATGGPALWGPRLAVLIAEAATWFVGFAAAFTVIQVGWAASGAAKRRQVLLRRDNANPLPPPATLPEGRRIVILCDGTGNRPDDAEEGQPATTNVWKLYRALVCDETQTTWYDPGVATDTSSTAQRAGRSRALLTSLGASPAAQVLAFGGRMRRLWEGVTGTGITENVAEAYAEVVRQYRPGDRIYLIGFSRGAYTARLVAAVIARCGLLRAEYLRYAVDVVQLYRTREEPDRDVPVPEAMRHADVRIEFLGIFDTVASLGVPLWGWWFRLFPSWNNAPLQPASLRICDHIHHALAMDERRSQFFPTPLPRPAEGDRTVLRQVWFRGAHADVGGGYAGTGLSDITLGWMMDALEKRDLRFRPDARKGLRPDHLALPHDELVRQPSWRLFGSWPRWYPVPGDRARQEQDAPPGTLHRTVLRRAHVLRKLGRPEMLRLRIGQSEVIDVDAHREWHRSGIALGHGETVRITWTGGLWRDAEGSPCGPDGQDPKGLDLARRLYWWRRRLPKERWMTLAVILGHPRTWLVRELGFGSLVKYLFLTDPPEMLHQIAPIGRDLAEPNAAVCIKNDAAGGLLYFFGNDLWLTAKNNSGALRLQVERIEAAAAGDRLWTVESNGCWVSPEGRLRQLRMSGHRAQ